MTEILPAELHQIKEFEEILQMLKEPAEDEKLRLYDVPEVSSLFEQVILSLTLLSSP